MGKPHLRNVGRLPHGSSTENGQADPNSCPMDFSTPAATSPLARPSREAAQEDRVYGFCSCWLYWLMFAWHNLNLARLSIPGEKASSVGVQGPGKP